MDDDLIAYLLESLPPDARQRVEARLRDDPNARVRLERFRRVLAPLAEDAASDEPPPALALNTLARVAEYKCRLPYAPAPACSPDGAPWSGFRRIDLVVAACLLLLVGGLLFPAITKLWGDAGRTNCQNNLRMFFVGLDAHANLHGGKYPRVEAEGPFAIAGRFVADLNEAGLINGVSVDCPATGRREAPPITLAHLKELYNGDPRRFSAAARQLTSNLDYTIGFEEAPGGELQGLTANSGDGMALLADGSGPGGRNSANHGGSGQNVLFVGGHVRWATSPEVGLERDHIFLNQNKKREAGVCRTDSVLAPASAGPRGPAD